MLGHFSWRQDLPSLHRPFFGLMGRFSERFSQRFQVGRLTVFRTHPPYFTGKTMENPINLPFSAEFRVSVFPEKGVPSIPRPISIARSHRTSSSCCAELRLRGHRPGRPAEGLKLVAFNTDAASKEMKMIRIGDTPKQCKTGWWFGT